MRKAKVPWILGILIALSGSVRGDIKTSGEIQGTVSSTDKSLLPGATVTLTGEGLIQKEIAVTTGGNGSFRFSNLNPGEYTIAVAMPGFASQQTRVQVGVGKTSTVPIVLDLGKTSAEITVKGEAPLIDTTSPQLSTNYNTKLLEQLPTTRNYIDVLESAPTVTDRSAYGAGGNVDGYDKFGFGAATNSYSLNGVMVNALEFGNTFVNPNYDTIAEIQLVGPGASAEYGSYTGAAVNVVTKSGTNTFHGGVSAWYTSDRLTADNSGGIADLKSDVVKDNWEGAVNVGGPIIKEKLLFFASVADYQSQTAPFRDPNGPADSTYFYNDQKRQSYQLRLDYLLNNANTISGMYNRDPVHETNDGLLPCCAADIGYTYDHNTNTAFVSWQSVWGTNTSSELRYAGVNGHLYKLPVASLDVPRVSDYRVGHQVYNSAGYTRQQANNRDEGIGTVTHYVDKFLGASHELKAGAEYEYGQTKTFFVSGGNTLLYILPYSATQNYLEGIVNYNQFQRTILKRPAAFVNDNLRFGSKLTANVGVRFDRPSYSDQNNGKTLLQFNNWSPRLGVSYDITGDGKTVFHTSVGRYYEKVPTYGPGYYTGTGNTPITYYGLYTDAAIDPRNYQALEALIIQPENITSVFNSQAVPVIGNVRNPRSDVFSASVERQLGPRTSLGLSFVAKEESNFLGLLNTNNPQFVPYSFTTNFSNNPPPINNPTQFDGLHPPLWNLVGAQPNQAAFGNVDALFQHQRLLTLELKSNPIDNLRVNASFTYEHTRGNADNNEAAVLSLGTNYVADNPNVLQNPYALGDLSAVHKYQAKVYGYYNLPWDIAIGASYRWLSGTPWGVTVASYRIPGYVPAGGFSSVLLEPRDARTQPSASLLDLQLAKSFSIGPATLTALVSVTNVLNTGYQTFDYYNNDPYGTYTYQRNPDGSPASDFAKPQGFNSGPPRVTRFGFRATF